MRSEFRFTVEMYEDPRRANLTRIASRGTAAICNAFLRGNVAGDKYCVPTDTNSLILHLPNAVICQAGAIVPFYIVYGDARSYICRYFGYLDLISTRCKPDAGSTSR